MERSRQERIFDLNSLRSPDRNCVRIFVFHQLYMSVLFHYEVTRVFEPTNTWRPTLLDSIIVVQIENLFLSGPFHQSKLLSFFCIRQMWTDSWIRRKKNTTQPVGDRTQVFRLPVGRSNHWATKPRQELRANFCLSPTVSFLSLRGDPSVRAYKHVETNETRWI